jgi:hypothetical protein
VASAYFEERVLARLGELVTGGCRWANNPKLATWVGNVRRRKKRGLLSSQLEAELNGLGFQWDRFGDSWNGMFGELETYQKRYGDCDVPSQWEQNPKLANWLQQQRQERRKGKLSVAREALLDALGFEWSRRKTNRDSSGSSCRPLQHTTKGHQQESHRRSRSLRRSGV